MEPLITIYPPTPHKGRWLVRADINAKGERVELQASASDRLAQKAQHWYNAAAEWLGQFVQYVRMPSSPFEQPGRGVFGDLPVVALSVAESIPDDPDMASARALVEGAELGDPSAEAQILRIAAGAEAGDRWAADALRKLELIEAARHARASVLYPEIVCDAQNGCPQAWESFAALRCVTPCEFPTRLRLDMDDYEPLCSGDRLCADAACAVIDEIGARIADPWGGAMSRERYLRPHQREMLHFYTMAGG